MLQVQKTSTSSSSSSQRLNLVELRSGGGDDVAVRRRLRHLDGLLLLQHQEAVELGGRLLPVVVPAQLQQAHRVCARLGHDALGIEG